VLEFVARRGIGSLSSKEENSEEQNLGATIAVGLGTNLFMHHTLDDVFLVIFFDGSKQCATLLGFQVQSVVARVNFSHKRTWGLYRTLGEQSKKLYLFSSGNLQNNLLVLRPQLHRVLVKHMVLNVSKINNKCSKINMTRYSKLKLLYN
jgi:hypothetical protein